MGILIAVLALMLFGVFVLTTGQALKTVGKAYFEAGRMGAWAVCSACRIGVYGVTLLIAGAALILLV